MDDMANPPWKRCLSFPGGSNREMRCTPIARLLSRADIAISILFLVLHRFRRSPAAIHLAVVAGTRPWVGIPLWVGGHEEGLPVLGEGTRAELGQDRRLKAGDCVRVDGRSVGSVGSARTPQGGDQ